MKGFNHILNWKLKAGSHLFPGTEGGTCINEAALVAAGFRYRPIRRPGEMPDCFSRPICDLAMRLNVQANDEERQRLLPYVTRLACADVWQVERQREAYIYSSINKCRTFERRLELLEGALAIGRQADTLGPREVMNRMEAVRCSATLPTSAPRTPVFSKVMQLFRRDKEGAAV
jgi:hypothetical protein